LWGPSKLGLTNARIRGDNLIRFGADRLLTIRKGEHPKSKGEILKKFFFNNG
jgi:hypothetical protein